MPFFYARKEVFEWLKTGQKTIDVRKGNPRRGEIAIFQSGPEVLRLKIIKREVGNLEDVVRLDNFKLVVLSALLLNEAFLYLRSLYESYDGVFSAYYLSR